MCKKTFINHGVSLLHSLQRLASPDSSLCVPLCFWHSLQKVTMPFFWSLKQSLCCFPVPTQQLLPSRSAPARAENGDWTHTSLDQWARWRPSGCRDASAGFGASLFTSTPPPPHLRLRDCCKETCRGVVGGATSLIALHYFWPPTYHSPLHPVSSPCICQGEKDWHMHCFQLLHSVHLEFMS